MSLFILRMEIGVGGGSENGNLPYPKYAVKMSLRKGVGGSKKPQN